MPGDPEEARKMKTKKKRRSRILAAEVIGALAVAVMLMVLTTSLITENEAKYVALTRVNLKPEDVTFTKVKLEDVGSDAYYAVEVRRGDRNYFFQIDAVEGIIEEFRIVRVQDRIAGIPA